MSKQRQLPLHALSGPRQQKALWVLAGGLVQPIGSRKQRLAPCVLLAVAS